MIPPFARGQAPGAERLPTARPFASRPTSGNRMSGGRAAALMVDARCTFGRLDSASTGIERTRPTQATVEGAVWEFPKHCCPSSIAR
jgi:hypothetical protein